MSALAIIGTESVTIQVIEEAVADRDFALLASKACASVTSAEEAQAAVDALRELRAVQKQVEDSRTQVKAPILDLGRKVDATAREFLAEVGSEVVRLNGAVTAWQREQDELRRQAEALRARQIREQEQRERQAKEAADRAEKARLAQEAAAAAALSDPSRDVDPFSEAEAQAGVAALTAAAAQAQTAAVVAREETTAVVVATAAAVAPATPQGMQVRRTPEFRIDDLLAFANARPDLVTITPKRAEILAEMRKLKEWDGERPLAAGAVGWWFGKVVV